MNEKYYLYSDIKEIVNNLKIYHNKIYGKCTGHLYGICKQYMQENKGIYEEYL